MTLRTNQIVCCRCVLNFQPLERIHRESPHIELERRRILLPNTGFLTENGKNKYKAMDLDSMKYPELRSLAKKLGLKANMKVL